MSERDYHEAWRLVRAEEERQALEWCADMSDVRDEADEGLEPDVETEVICE